MEHLRTRSTVIDEPNRYQGYVTYVDDSTDTFDSVYTPAGAYAASSIEDVAGKRRRKRGVAKKKRYAPTPCDHTSVRHVDLSWPRGGARHTGAALYKTAFNEWGHPFTREALIAEIIHATEGEIWDFADAAFASLSAQIPEQISVPNFLLELGDLTSMFNLADLLKVKYSRGEAVQNAILYNEFGLKPFISDIKILLSLAKTLEDRIRFLKSSRGKRTRIGYFRETERAKPPWHMYETRSSSALQRTPGILWACTPLSRSSRFYAGAYVTHYLEGLDSLDGYLRALAVATGFSNPLRAAWNAIPFSFVIDWITNLSDLLTHAPARPFEGKWAVEDFTWSVTDRVVYRLVAENPGTDISNPFLPQELGQIHAQRYRRGVSLPKRVVNLDLPPSLREAVLIAALLRG